MHSRSLPEQKSTLSQGPDDFLQIVVADANMHSKQQEDCSSHSSSISIIPFPHSPITPLN